MFSQLEHQNVNPHKDREIQSLAKQWAKKYVHNLEDDIDNLDGSRELATENQRLLIAERLRYSLRNSSLQAWNKTEYLIGKEIQRHRINPKLIDPWQISEDVFTVYEKTLEVYAQMLSPQQLSRIISPYLGAIRKKYTANDPRVIGFVSMQFHYTGLILVENLSIRERTELLGYLKVIDDHLYMPLQRAYDAAANQNYDSETLKVVQQLLPVSTEIAHNICDRVIELYPNYSTYSGSLKNPVVKTASIRDVEMFQVYLWVCVLENNISAIQQELFPLCVMVYPTLKVRWELVRQMVNLLGKEIESLLGREEQKLFIPYFQALREMFSPEVFPESLGNELSHRFGK
ncbi:hypothetical protein ACE1B6_15705 [Aerosakkonemataceae cyanobacterium BLCC-F154]|uniref:Uncharacterized protein n=1 Tax=Floridaenema fluviatile BLCC-F154 TaxID=3153640 RepID=A0ABV4YCZ5_9CYAN